MTNEPEIITHNREQLAYLLTEAAEIEHGLMCCYLFAAHTLRRGAAEGLRDDEVVAVERWRGAIVQVAVEEMLHLALVSNLLSAIESIDAGVTTTTGGIELGAHESATIDATATAASRPSRR